MPYVSGPTWDADLTPPADYTPIFRRSMVWPYPAVAPLTGEVTNWDTPTSEVIQDIGYLQVRINGIDVTWLEAGDGGPFIPTQVMNWEIAEPFDDAICIIHFPTIYPWDPLPTWLVHGCDVDLIWKQPSTADRTIFEGFFVSEEVAIPGPGSLSIHCMGAVYQLDMFVDAPTPMRRVKDVTELMVEVFTASHRGMRLLPPTAITSGVTSRRAGTFDTAGTGTLQSLLNHLNSNYTSAPYTIMKTPGRQVVLAPKVTSNSIALAHSPADWTVTAGVPGVDAALSRDITTAPLAIYAEGTAPDGGRWRNMKTPAYTNATPAPDDRDTADAPYIMPVSRALIADPWLYQPDGTRYAVNPFYDPTQFVVEKFVSAGEHITLAEFKDASDLEMLENLNGPKYMGTITLTADPEEGHRRFIRAGQNIRIKFFRGASDGAVFHISRVAVDHQSGSVTLTVDQNSRDISVIDGLLNRVKDANDPSKQGLRNQRKSRSLEDRNTPWDSETGSGMVNPVAVTANTWKIIRVAAGEEGTIVRSAFRTSVAAKFAIGVFAYKVTTGALTGAGNPLTTPGYWQNFSATIDLRPMISWGGMLPDGTLESAGHYPGLESQGATNSGVFVDDGTWDFVSNDPPWFWLAVYCDHSTTFQGGTDSSSYRAFRLGID